MFSAKKPTSTRGALLRMAGESGGEGLADLITDQYFPSLFINGNIRGDTVLHDAARRGDSNAIDAILNGGEFSGYENFKEALCRKRNALRNTALHEAVMMGHVEGVRLLFSADKVVAHYPNKECKSPLYLAMENKNEEIVDILFPSASSFLSNHVWRRQEQPTAGTIQNCDNIIERLEDEERKKRELKAEETQRQGQPWSSHPILQLESYEAKEILSPELRKAVKDQDVSSFTSTLERKCTQEELCLSEIVNGVNPAGDTMLHIAANFGSQEIVQLIANRFPQLIISRNIKGATPLHVATRARNLHEMIIILSCYAKHCENRFYKDEEEKLCRIKNDYGNTALHEAVRLKYVEGASLLLSADRIVTHYLNKEGKSPLYLAVEYKNKELVDVLLHAPFHNVERHRGNSPLHAAILEIRSSGKKRIPTDLACHCDCPNPPAMKCGHFYDGFQCHCDCSRTLAMLNPCGGDEREARLYSEGLDKLYEEIVLEQLLEQRYELIHLRDQQGGTPLHCAASMGHVKAVRALLRVRPLSALEHNTKGYLPIHVACEEGHVNVMKEIVGRPGVDPLDLLNRKGQNILHIAAKNGKDEVVKYILKKKKLQNLLNEKDRNGNTALHLASKYLHPKCLLLLTKDERVEVKLINNECLTARDIVLLRWDTLTTFRKIISFAILYSAGVPLSEKGSRFRETRPPQIEWIKDRINTLMLVAILVATVTFAAVFTMPGGFNSSDHSDPRKKGMATLVNRRMFQIFTVCDMVAMYSSTIGSFILLWAQLGDFHLAFSAAYFALYLVGLSLVTMSIAFMAAIHLVVGNVSWLASAVIIIGIISLSLFLAVYLLLIFPLGARAPLLRQISSFISRIIIPFSGSYGKLNGNKKKRKLEQQPEKEKDKDEAQDVRIIVPETRQS